MIFLFPTELEATPFRLAAPNATIVICGVGMAQCGACVARLISQMRECGESQTLVLTGVAGSYDLNRVALAEVVEVASEKIHSLPERFGVEYTLPERLTELRAVSSNTVNTSREVGEEYPSNIEIENMEGAIFMSICAEFGVRHTQIRAISNRVGDPFGEWSLDEALTSLTTQLLDICVREV